MVEVVGEGLLDVVGLEGELLVLLALEGEDEGLDVFGIELIINGLGPADFHKILHPRVPRILALVDHNHRVSRPECFGGWQVLTAKRQFHIYCMLLIADGQSNVRHFNDLHVVVVFHFEVLMVIYVVVGVLASELSSALACTFCSGLITPPIDKLNPIVNYSR